MELQTGSANGKHSRTLREQEEWQLTDAEIAGIERATAPNTKIYAIRLQTQNLYKIEVEASNPDEAHKKAIEQFKADNSAAALLRNDYGHSTIEKLGYQNAVFPHYNAKGICGLELKNTDKTFFARGSEKTLWRSNRKATDDTLIIAEAVLDVLSYHLLFESETAMYAATGGGMSPDQAALIRDFAQNSAALKKIILITDNDQGGDKLTARIIAAIGEGEFSGEVVRHSPDIQGEDWNDVLTNSQP